MPARISFYRPTGQSRRQARSAHDHDVFEGLPVRRWSRDWVSVGKSAPPPPPQPELPLPKETHLLQPMSQALLQAARSSSSTTPKPVPAAPSPPGGRRFMTKRWVRIPRNMEGPEPVYLAKVPDRPRRRGEEIVEVQQQQMQTPTAAVTAVRRRVPPPKRKAKPRGRKPGQKKSVSFAEERLRTFPVVVPHNNDSEASDEPNPTPVSDTVMEDAAPVVVEETKVEAKAVEEKKEEEKKEERKEHPLPPRPAGLPPKPVGAADLGAK